MRGGPFCWGHSRGKLVCNACSVANMSAAPTYHTSRSGEGYDAYTVAYVDLAGSSEGTRSRAGSFYLLVAVIKGGSPERPNYLWARGLAHKDDAIGAIEHMITELASRGHRLKAVVTDGGGEFVSDAYQRHGVSHRITTREGHNDLAEGAIRTIYNTTRPAMLDVPPYLWEDCVLHAVDAHNKRVYEAAPFMIMMSHRRSDRSRS